ncbi:MAG TPA: hypothetical protein VMW72_03445 [Sedimentisphaerales bacterium]|nr:hypothetical protein [Sedimentisphaerales bacterium]
MNRREFLGDLVLAGAALPLVKSDVRGAASTDLTQDWLARWEKNILGRARSRYCDKEMGEQLGWLVSPFLNGFYYGYLATRDPKWVEMLIDWMDSCVRRGVEEPDGFVGWPKSGMDATESFYTDSLLGEAMVLRPVVLTADEILKTPSLKGKFDSQAQAYLRLAERVFEKWDSRGCWREIANGGLWVVPLFGIDPKTGQWTEGYARRNTDGFSNPDNKENHIARWLIAMYDVTRKPVYRERAEKWFRLMKSRMKTRQDGTYFVWNYWDPAGTWDCKADGSPKHWVGVHPNGGYYGIDVEAIVTAFEHGLVFTKEDIQRLIATNRDFMWNQQVTGAKFQRIDGGQPDPRWRNSPGVLWTALVPYDETLRRVFLTKHNPSGWDGLSATPWFLALEGAGYTGAL